MCDVASRRGIVLSLVTLALNSALRHAASPPLQKAMSVAGYDSKEMNIS